MTHRRLRFRAWHQEEGEKGEMIHFGLFETDQGYHIESQYSLDECPIMQFTGIKDRNGKDIYEADIVSLDGNMTADDSLGYLPNGWHFDKDDCYAVAWDAALAGWVLDLGEVPDSAYNAKYMNHARSLLVNGDVTVIGDVYATPDLAAVKDWTVSETAA